MSKTSWVELCVSDFEQSITWFENVLGFRVVALEADEYAELSRGETALQLAPDHAPYWASERHAFFHRDSAAVTLRSLSS